MTSDLRVAILGAGYIASWHADAIRATPGLRLAEVTAPYVSMPGEAGTVPSLALAAIRL